MKHTTNLITRDFSALTEPTGNIYEAISIISRRARQIAVASQEELDSKLVEFISDETDEVKEEELAAKQEQAEITRVYEKMPKPTTIAVEEFLGNKLMYRYPDLETIS